MRTADGRINPDRRQFLRIGFKTAAVTGLLSKISMAQPSPAVPTTTITGTLVNVISPGVTETSQITVTTNTDPNTPPGQFTEDVVYTGSIKFVSDGEMVALKFTIPPMVANGIDAFPTNPSGSSAVIVSNGVTNFDEHDSIFSMTIDNATGTSGQISTSSTGSTFTFMILQGAAALQARKKRRTLRVASTGQETPADPPIPVPVVWLLGLAVVICAIVVLVKAFVDDCVKQAATQCGSAGVKSIETDITLGFNFKTWKIGCTSECIIMCNQSS